MISKTPYFTGILEMIYGYTSSYMIDYYAWKLIFV